MVWNVQTCDMFRIVRQRYMYTATMCRAGIVAGLAYQYEWNCTLYFYRILLSYIKKIFPVNNIPKLLAAIAFLKYVTCIKCDYRKMYRTEHKC